MSEKKTDIVLVSVADKTGLAELGERVNKLGLRILSSGGTGGKLKEAGLPVTTTAEFSGLAMATKLMRSAEFQRTLEEIAGFAVLSEGDNMARLKQAMAKALEVGAMFDHRLATISSPLYGALLSDPTNPKHMAELDEVGWEDVFMVICDFYPLARTLAMPGVTLADVIRDWDVGGPAMIDAAAKSDRLPICRLADREMVLHYLETQGSVPPEVRMQLRQTAVFEIARYKMELAMYLGPDRFEAMMGESVRQLAYAENRDQSPATLFNEYNTPLAWQNFKVLTGDPSYISIADGDRARGIMCAMAEAFRINCGKVPFIAIACKHGGPCGIGVDFDSPEVALKKALHGDPVAVMGAELMVNFPIDEKLGRIIYEVPTDEQQVIGREYWGIDVLYAPTVDEATVELLGKKDKRRILTNLALADPKLSSREWMRVEVEGGFLRQRKYHYVLDLNNLAGSIGDFGDHVVDMIIAWAATWRSVSNTVAVAKNGMLQALGGGQKDRIACTQLCLDCAARSRHDTRESSFASDGFFPYARRTREDAPLEGPELLVQAGCKALVVPYDGKNIAKVEAYLQQAGVAVAFVKPEHRGFFGHNGG